MGPEKINNQPLSIQEERRQITHGLERYENFRGYFLGEEMAMIADRQALDCINSDEFQAEFLKSVAEETHKASEEGQAHIEHIFSLSQETDAKTRAHMLLEGLSILEFEDKRQVLTEFARPLRPTDPYLDDPWMSPYDANIDSQDTTDSPQAADRNIELKKILEWRERRSAEKLATRFTKGVEIVIENLPARDEGSTVVTDDMKVYHQQVDALYNDIVGQETGRRLQDALYRLQLAKEKHVEIQSKISALKSILDKEPYINYVEDEVPKDRQLLVHQLALQLVNSLDNPTPYDRNEAEAVAKRVDGFIINRNEADERWENRWKNRR